MRLATFLLAMSVALPAAAAPAGKPKRPDEVVCKLLNETGSRIRINRVCMTRGDWEREELRMQMGFAELQQRDGGDGQSRGGVARPGPQ